jgi:hypothetical protein
MRSETPLSDAPPEDDRDAVLLPPELDADEVAVRSLRASQIGLNTKEPKISVAPLDEADGSGQFGAQGTGPFPAQRLSRISRVSQWAGVGQRTSLVEIAQVTETVARITQDRIPLQGLRFRVAVGGAALFSLVLLATIASTSGNWRWVPLGGFFVFVTVLLTYGTIRQIPRLTRRFGELSLPGRAGMWIGLAISALASTGALVTWGAQLASVRLAGVLIPVLTRKPPPPPEPAPTATAVVATERPPMPGRWTGHVWASPGSLFMPTSFYSDDGSFDLVLHFHGNPELVSASASAAKINALVHVTNLGLGSMAYRTHYAVGGLLDAMIGQIEMKTSERIGRPMKVRRLAFMCWSAGFGAVQSLLEQPGVLERVDALLVTDGIHPGYLPGGHEVDPAGIAQFVRFAKEAKAGRKLMVVTHSAIPTTEYASSTESADAILKALGADRAPFSESPSSLTFESAVNAFPARQVNWLQARSAAHAGNFHLYGYAGNDKPDHIAHLAQLSVTVLPELVKRWAAPVEVTPAALSAAIK